MSHLVIKGTIQEATESARAYGLDLVGLESWDGYTFASVYARSDTLLAWFQTGSLLSYTRSE